jgi:ribosomal protein S11
MNLSNTLFNSLTNKLKLDTYLLEKERFYVKNLLSQIDYLKKLKEKNYKTLSVNKFTEVKHKESISQDLMVMYIINISFLKANTTIHVSDIKGNIKLFYSAGFVGLTGKQKRKRRIAVVKLISLLIKKANFLGKKPIALHLNNVNFYQNLILNKLKQTFYVKVIKSFNQAPYNGCRKRKVRRKKYTKKFK